MPRITIWNHKQIKAYETPPVFTSTERIHFLRLPPSLQTIVDNLKAFTNQIGFQLMFGYFMARKRFYPVETFHQEDILFFTAQMGILSFAFNSQDYKRQTYARHRQMILSHFGVESFEPPKHIPLIQRAIEEQIISYERPNYILPFILEWLEWRQIELPRYHALQLMLTETIRERNRQVSRKLNGLLKPSHKTYLDTLFLKETNGHTLIHNLKKLSPSDRPKQIQANLNKLSQVWAGYSLLKPVLSALHFNDKAIRFFGEMAIASTSYQLQRRKEADKYLLLTMFLAYQLYKFQDWMIDTFLAVCQTYLNKAQNAQKDALYVNRKAHKQALKESVSMAQNHLELLAELRQIVWMDESRLPAEQKMHQLQTLLPLDQPDPYLQQTQTLVQIRDQHQLDGKEDFYPYLKNQSQALQLRASPILKQIHFNTAHSNADLMKAIQVFCKKEGQITPKVPCEFLGEADQKALIDSEDKFQVSLYKMFLFRQCRLALKSGDLNLSYSFTYKAMDQYLIPKAQWEEDPDAFLEKANLIHLKDVHLRLEDFNKRIHHHFTRTNERILNKENPHFQRSKRGNYMIKTPKREKEKADTGVFPDRSLVPMSQVLATIEQATGYLQAFEHWQPHYRKTRPDKQLFFATIAAYGSNLGIPAMAQSSLNLTASQLENVANWYFTQQNIQKANDIIVNFMDQMELPNLYRKQIDQLRTSSDGQKIKVASSDTIFATFSFKYFGKGKGVSSYGFVDERGIPYYGTMPNSSEREAHYVLDGMLHNPQIQSTFHVTDTHGYSEAIFGAMDLLGFDFAPIIAKLYDQKLYSFEKIAAYQQKGYQLLPSGYVQEKRIEQNWNDILRMICSLKLKYVLPSQLFKRLNSYSRQHPLYAALKAYGRMPKTLHILRYTDELERRQDARFMQNHAENNNKFNKAVFFNNGGEMIFLTKEEQLRAEACKNLIKNAIICWNYLYMTRLIQQVKDPEERQQKLKEVQLSSPMTWKHLSFSGQYDFSDEYLSDAFDLLGTENYNLNLE